MGFFGGNKSNKVSPVDVGDNYVHTMENGNLPVAVPIDTQAIITPSAPSVADLDSNPTAATTTTTSKANNGWFQKSPIPLLPSQLPPTIPTAPARPVLPLEPLRRYPSVLRPCPYCHQDSRTRIHTFPNVLSWIVLVVVLCLFWPLFWLPLVVDSLKQTDHYCMTCQTKVGSVQPFVDCCEKHRS